MDPVWPLFAHQGWASGARPRVHTTIRWPRAPSSGSLTTASGQPVGHPPQPKPVAVHMRLRPGHPADPADLLTQRHPPAAGLLGQDGPILVGETVETLRVDLRAGDGAVAQHAHGPTRCRRRGSRLCLACSCPGLSCLRRQLGRLPAPSRLRRCRRLRRPALRSRGAIRCGRVAYGVLERALTHCVQLGQHVPQPPSCTLPRWARRNRGATRAPPRPGAQGLADAFLDRLKAEQPRIFRILSSDGHAEGHRSQRPDQAADHEHERLGHPGGLHLSEVDDPLGRPAEVGEQTADDLLGVGIVAGHEGGGWDGEFGRGRAWSPSCRP